MTENSTTGSLGKTLDNFDVNVSNNKENASEAILDSYFNDDEACLSINEELLNVEDNSVIVKQDDVLVSWSIENLYDDNGKVLSKRELKNSPPILKVVNSNDEEVAFVLTKELSAILANHFENTYRAYFGLRPKSERTFREKISDTKNTLSEHKGKFIFFGGVIVALIVASFVF